MAAMPTGSTAPVGAVLVTGAGSGIGRATARRLLTLGRDVVAWDLHPAGLDTLSEHEGTTRPSSGRGRLLTRCLDVTEPAAVAAGMAEAVDDVGTPGALITCAGPPSLAATDFDEGLRATVNAARVPIEAWLAAGVPGGAVAVQVASISGTLVGGEGPDWYSAGKAGLVGYSRWLARHRPGGIRSNAVAPGIVDTPRVRGMLESGELDAVLDRIPMRSSASAEDVAAVLAFLISPEAGYLNGVVLPIEGGLTLT